MISVATGKDFRGTGVWSFIKIQGTPDGRAALAGAIVAAGVAATNPQIVTTALADNSVNTLGDSARDFASR